MAEPSNDTLIPVEKLGDLLPEITWMDTHGHIVLLVLMAIVAVAGWLMSKKAYDFIMTQRTTSHAGHSLRNPKPGFIILSIATLAIFISLGAAILYPDSAFVEKRLLPGVGLFWLVSLIFMLVPSVVLASLISLLIVTATILAMLGLLEQTTQWLDKFAVTVGDLKISLWMAIKGVIIFLALLWCASFVNRGIRIMLVGTKLSFSVRDLMTKLATILVYVLVFIITLDMLGINLTAFAFIGGALGVGIGFGLQKITANFISGIILLSERSIKVDDIVDIGPLSGTVKEIGIRYTLLKMADGREVFVPNEEFMVERVISSTHTDKRSRVEIKVGVSYDSDPEQVQKLLLEIAKAHPLCSRDPKPACFLNTFGESALIFILFFWVDDVVESGKFSPQHDVMVEILKRFRAEGIEIPYPQQDMHVRSLPKQLAKNPESQQ